MSRPGARAMRGHRSGGPPARAARRYPGLPARIERVVTARMVCERLVPEHADELRRLLLDSEVIRTSWPYWHPPTAEDIAASLSAKVDHWDRHGFGLWLARDRHTGETVGRGGLQYTYASGLDAVEVAWTITPRRWRQGLGTELARAALHVAFERLDLLEVVAMTLPDNLASRRVMEKAGFVYEREIEHAGLPHVLYRCRRGR
jgi:[ribosomal protein S5]-alanine N-acetyltransferase